MRLLLAVVAFLLLLTASAGTAGVVVLPGNGAVGPETADYFHRGLAHAVQDGAQLLVLQVDTQRAGYIHADDHQRHFRLPFRWRCMSRQWRAP
jgi:hypothetical protein